MSVLEESYQKAIDSLEKKLHHKASSEFSHILAEDDSGIYLKQLKALFEKLSAGAEVESILAVGMAILKYTDNKAELANLLGNFSRKVNNTQQALNLFKFSLKEDPKNLNTIHNIGATLARSSRKDQDAIHAAEYFPHSMKYAVPDFFVLADGKYKCAPKLIEELQKGTLAENLKQIHPGETSEDARRGQAKSDDALGSLNRAQKEHEVFLEYFDKIGEHGEDHYNLSSYNKAVYCIKNLLFQKAESALHEIQEASGYPFRYVPVLKAILLVVTGKMKEAEEVLYNLLAKPINRYAYVNIGLVYRNTNDKLKSLKYLIGAYELLQRSDWNFEIQLFIEQLHSNYSTSGDNLNRKHAYEQLIREQNEDAQSYFNLAGIYLASQEHVKAAQTYKLSAETDKEGHLRRESLNKIDDIFEHYENEGNTFFAGNKFRLAFKCYYSAYRIKNTIPTAKKALNALHYFTPDESELEIRNQLRESVIRLEQTKNEKSENKKQLLADKHLNAKWQGLLAEADKHISEKKYHNAMEKLESAFRINPDKDTFLKLASLYKNFKKIPQLNDLAARYKKHLEIQEKTTRFASKDTNSII